MFLFHEMSETVTHNVVLGMEISNFFFYDASIIFQTVTTDLVNVMNSLLSAAIISCMTFHVHTDTLTI